jgi:integrase
VLPTYFSRAGENYFNGQIADQLGHAKVSVTQDNYLGRRLTNRRTAETLHRALGQTLA